MVLTVYITFWRGQATVCSLVAKPANSVYVISITVSKKHHNTAFFFFKPHVEALSQQLEKQLDLLTENVPMHFTGYK